MKKKITGLICAVIICMAAQVMGEEIETQDKWSSALKTAARNMVQAGVKEGDAVEMIGTMERARIREQNIVQAQQIIQKALQQGLPAEGIMEKVHEGVAKQVPGELIVKAMEQVRSRYAYSYAKAEKFSTSAKQKEQLGQAIADGLTAGLVKGDVDRVLAQVEEKTADMDESQKAELALQVMEKARDMVRQGVASETAAGEMHQMMNRNTVRQAASSKDGAFSGNSDNGGQGSGSGNSSGSGGSGSGGGAGGSGNGSGGGPGKG